MGGVMYAMSDDGWEPLGYVGEDAIVPSELDDELPYNLPLDIDGGTYEFSFEAGPQVVDMLVGSDHERLHFDKLVVQQRIVTTRPYRLFMRALDGDDKKFRNYMKALRRSMRNSHAGG